MSDRSIPKWAYRHEGVANQDRPAVGGDTSLAGPGQPLGGLLTGCIGTGEVVVARTDDHPSDIVEESEVAEDDLALGIVRHGGGDIETVARRDDKVESRGRADHLVELTEGVVEIGDEKDVHRCGFRRVPALAPNSEPIETGRRYCCPCRSVPVTTGPRSSGSIRPRGIRRSLCSANADALPPSLPPLMKDNGQHPHAATDGPAATWSAT